MQTILQCHTQYFKINRIMCTTFPPPLKVQSQDFVIFLLLDTQSVENRKGVRGKKGNISVKPTYFSDLSHSVCICFSISCSFSPTNLLYCALSLVTTATGAQLPHPTATSARRDAMQCKTHTHTLGETQ